jgi:ATP-dependent RNA helicase DeaD
MNKLKFTELKLSPELAKAVAEMGFEEATPIQSLSIPVILEGKDVMGQAQTGTGKTAAFGIPILEKTDTQDRRTQAIVLCPTRELAIQVAEEIATLGKFKRGLSVLAVYGGQPIYRQIQALQRGVQVVVGTPGRVKDHLERKTLRFDAVRMVVLDEADEMLDMGFREDIESILKTVPEVRQTVFFSATMPRDFLEMARRFQKDPARLKVEHDKLNAPAIQQSYCEVREYEKADALTRVIDAFDFSKALVFCNTKRKTDEVTAHLQARGYFAEAIHGDMNQVQRDRVMAKFRKGTVEYLVATDVAARGIDVEDIDAVLNYDVPQDEDAYVHRIGRTGRAGKSGRAVTFASGRDFYKLREIIRFVKSDIRRIPVPTMKDVEETKATQFLERVREALKAPDLDRYAAMVAERFVNEETTSLDVAAALLRLLSDPSQGSGPRPDAFKPESREERPNREFDRPREMREPGASRDARDSRGPRPAWKKDAVPRERRGSQDPGERTVFRINAGHAKRVTPGDIVGAIAGETGLPGSAIGPIRIQDDCSFVGVPALQADRVMKIMSASQIRGNRITFTPVEQKPKFKPKKTEAPQAPKDNGSSDGEVSS